MTRFSLKPLLLIATLCVGLLALSSCEKKQQDYSGPPPWWPEAVDYPPPKPDTPDFSAWNTPWPPQDERAHDLAFWVYVMRNLNEMQPEKITKPKGDDDIRFNDISSSQEHNHWNPSADGYSGHQTFAKSFPPIDTRGKKTKEGISDCGVFSYYSFLGEAIESCDPYPDKNITALCNKIENIHNAQKTCQWFCDKAFADGSLPTCRTGKIYQPAAFLDWNCTAGAGISDDPTKKDQAFCRGLYLCECYNDMAVEPLPDMPSPDVQPLDVPPPPPLQEGPPDAPPPDAP